MLAPTAHELSIPTRSTAVFPEFPDLPTGTQLHAQNRLARYPLTWTVWSGARSDYWPILFSADLDEIADLGTWLVSWRPTGIDPAVLSVHATADALRTLRLHTGKYGCTCEWDWHDRHMPDPFLPDDARAPQAVDPSCPAHGGAL